MLTVMYKCSSSSKSINFMTKKQPKAPDQDTEKRFWRTTTVVLTGERDIWQRTPNDVSNCWAPTINRMTTAMRKT